MTFKLKGLEQAVEQGYLEVEWGTLEDRAVVTVFVQATGERHMGRVEA